MIQLTKPIIIADYSKAGAILIGGLLLFIIGLNAFAPQFFIELSSVIFVLILAGIVFAIGKFMFFRKTKQPFTLEIMFLYGGIVALGIFLLIKFPGIAGGILSIKAQEVSQGVMSLVGVG